MFSLDFESSIQRCPRIFPRFRVLPCLAKEFVNPAMIPFVLPNTMLIAENSSKEEYVEHILPLIAPVMKIQEPVQVRTGDVSLRSWRP